MDSQMEVTVQQAQMLGGDNLQRSPALLSVALGKTLASRANNCVTVSKWVQHTGKIGEPGSCPPAEP